jgi:type III restriction enzyme
METLSSKFDTLVSMDMISLDLPSYIKENLNKKFELRPYQEEALGRFAFFMDSYTKKKKPVHLLFNMATGSGKTIIMASCILSLYEKGYRNFVFFVNSKSIIEKTKDNFLNNLSSKYLFGKKIVINNKEVNICQVDNFQSTNDNDINILFTTIQGLHTSLNEPSENSITYEDFEENRVVLIADEAHHINSSTKSKLSKDEELEDTSWEYTVNKIFQHSAENILLEFTATIDLDNKNIYEKYEDKLIYKYSLAEFRENKYSKEVKILSADLEEIDRALNAIILSQYRLKIAEKYKLFIKPIILMKSKTIAESKAFEEKFNILIDGLNAEKINRIKTLTRSGVMLRAFNFFDSEDILMENLALEMKEAYSIEKTISVNSKDESEAKQLTINSLEDENNQIRVVFAVDKLNEGWDVLNLFDIVRLYTTRDSDKGKPGKTTMAEAQLIGRGARYNPFSLNGEDKFTRKYDSDLENDLRILEELYYHSAQDSRYISELHNALVKEGVIADRTVQCKLEIKESFKETDFWKYGRIFVNSRRDNTNANIFGFENTQIKKVYRYSVKTKTIQSINVLDKISELKTAETKDKKMHLSSFGKNIIKKAMAKNSFFTFSSIKKYFPHLSSVNEFIEDEKYLGNVSVEITGVESQITALNQSDKLDIAMDILRAPLITPLGVS